MKCIQCGRSNNRKDRLAHAGRCKFCGHRFALVGFSFTDSFFARAIVHISARNTLFFTFKQFLYLLDRRLNPKSYQYLVPKSYRYLAPKSYESNLSAGLALSILMIAIGALATIAIKNLFPILLATMLSIISICLKRKQQRQHQPTPQTKPGPLNQPNSFPNPIFKTFANFQHQGQYWLSCWVEVNGQPEKLLASPQEDKEAVAVSAEITNYSFDRVVVCDTAIMAQFLIANNFHFEHNCPVLSITGYPQTIFEPVLQMLRRNPDLKVYALHDANPQGVAMAERLRTSSQWFAGSTATIYDLGLLPGQVLKNSRLLLRQSEKFAKQSRQLATAVRQQLSAAELAWLDAGYFAELELFTPQRLLRIVMQKIAWSCLPDNDHRFEVWTLDPDEGYSDRQEIYRLSDDRFG